MLFDWVKANPGKSAAVVGLVVVIAYFASAPSSGASGTVAPVGDVEGGTAMQMLQAQLQDRASQRTHEEAMQDGAGGIQKYLSDLSASLSMASINADQQTRALEITSYTESQNFMATKAAETTQYGQLMDYKTDKLMADYMTTASNNMLEQQRVFVQGQTDIAKINKPKQGLFSMIFG